MSAKQDERVLDYWRLPFRKYIVKLKQYNGLGCETNLKNTLPAHLGSFVSNNSIRIMNNLIPEIDRFQMKNV